VWLSDSVDADLLPMLLLAVDCKEQASNEPAEVLGHKSIGLLIHLEGHFHQPKKVSMLQRSL